MQELLLSKSWPAEGIARLDVQTLFGDVVIKGYGGDEIQVVLMGKFYGWQFWTANRSLQEWLSHYDLLLEKQGNELRVQTFLKSGIQHWLHAMGMKFQIMVPQTHFLETDIRLEAGNIRVESCKGKHQLRTGAGNLRLEHVSGEVQGRTSAGSVDIRHCKANITAKSATGALEARHCEGLLSLSTSGGTIELHHIQGKVNVESSAGSIEAYDVDGALYAHTAAGTIELKGIKGGVNASTPLGTIEAEILLPSDYLYLETLAGSIEVRMPFDKGMDLEVSGMSVRMPRLAHFEGKREQYRVEGSNLGGGMPVKIQAPSGSIKVRSPRNDAIGALHETIGKTEFTLPPHFFRFEIQGVLLSALVCLMMVYGINAVLYLTAEQFVNKSMAGIYLGIILGNIVNAFAVVAAVLLFTRRAADMIRFEAMKYILLALLTFVCSFVGQLVLGIFYWRGIESPDNDHFVTTHPLWIYHFTAPVVACIYFTFWQRSRRITRKISEQEYQLLNLERLKTKAELDALQARINPHFLYNALNSIAGLVHENAEKAETMTLLLSKLFRFTIGTKDQHFNTVANELEIAQTYLDIEQVRFGARLRFALIADKSIENLEIPRFLLQPLVENAVKHGVSKIAGDGYIEVRIAKAQGFLHCCVHDNGPAFGEQFFTGYGLQSIRDKLNLLYDERASLDLQDAPHKQVIIQIPC